MHETKKTQDGLSETRGSEFAKVVAAVLKAVAGLRGLADPRPGSATLDQVRYVYPANYTSSRDKGLALDVPRTGRSLVLALRRDGSASKIIYLNLVKEFELKLGFCLQAKDDYDALTEKVSIMNQRFTLADVVTCLVTCCSYEFRLIG